MKLSFADFITHISGGKNPSSPYLNMSLYIEYLSMMDNFGELVSQTGISSLTGYLPFAEFLRELEESRNVWIGDGKTVGKLHFDPFENLLTMVKGSKTFTIFDISMSHTFREGHIR